MLGLGVFGQLDVGFRLLEAGDEALAGRDRVVVVGRAVEDADRLCDDGGIVPVGRGAIRVEGDVGGGLDAALVPELVEALDARIEHALAAAREAHQRDALRIDPRMLREDRQRPVHVDDEVEAPERGLVCADAGKAAPGHAVDDEGRDAHRVQLALPVADVAAGPARAVHQDHHRQPAFPLRDRQLAAERRRLGAGLVAGEELLICEREGLERMQLDADRHVPGGEGVGGSREG